MPGVLFPRMAASCPGRWPAEPPLGPAECPGPDSPGMAAATPTAGLVPTEQPWTQLTWVPATPDLIPGRWPTKPPLGPAECPAANSKPRCVCLKHRYPNTLHRYPYPFASTRRPARGTAHGLLLLVCGDIESNPGPEEAPMDVDSVAADKGACFLQTHRSEAYVPLQPLPPCHAAPLPNMLPSSSSTNLSGRRSAKAKACFNCPFDGCPYAKEHLSKETLVSHLSARHICSGQVVPPPVLAMLKHAVCTVCKTLHKAGASCQCHGPQLPDDIQAGSPSTLPPPDAPLDSCNGPCTPLTNDCPNNLLPSFEEVLAARISTVRRIPGACRRGVAACLCSLVSAFTQNPSWESLHSLQCFPKLVLRAPKRAGKAHTKQLAADIARRLRMFEAGHVATLWTEATTVLQRDKPIRTRAQAKETEGQLPRGVIQAIRGLVEEGALSKAAKHLLSTGLADADDPVVLERLRTLHPQAAPIVTGSDTPLPDHIDPMISNDDDECDWGKLAWDAVSSFAPGSAPGPSGLRPSHLKDCMQKVGKGSSLQCALGALAQVGIEQGLSGGARAVLCAANLIPLRKKDDSVRPIAVGETLRRLIGKCLLNTDRLKEQVQGLQPRQCGVAVKGATELVGMGLQRLVDARKDDPDWVVLTVDVSNAFNTIRRDTILRGCSKRVPAAYNWLRSCYQGHSPLFCQGKLLLHSQTGTHQGDACGPLGFVLGLEEALEAAGACDLDWECWYLDDGSLVGTAQAVFDYLGRLQVALGNVGLHLNLGKCHLWGPGIQDTGESIPHYPDGLALDHPGRAIPVIPFVENSGITLLGVPIDYPGSSHCTWRHWAAKVDETLALLDRLRLFPDGQIRHTLLRFCLDACRVMHLERSTVISKAGDAPQRLHDALRVAAEDLVSMGVSDATWAQVTLPLRLGGLGIRDPLQMQPSARMAALVGLELHGRERVGVPDVALTKQSSDLPATIASLQSQLGPHFEPLAGWHANPSQLASASFDHSSQRWWAEQVAKEHRSRLCQLGTARDMARLRAQEGPISNGWMSVLPSRALRTDINDGDYRVLLRWWLGLPLLPVGQTLPGCPACREPVDPFGDHFVCCDKNGSTRRHNALRDSLFEVLVQGSIPAAKEVTSGNRRRPADILLIAWERGRDVAVDLTVTHPLGLSGHPIVVQNVAHHCRRAEATKTVAEGELCRQAGWGFTPAAFTPWGGCGPSARALLHEVGRRATASLTGWPKLRRLRELHEGLSLTLAREVARQLNLRNRVQDACTGGDVA